jgi:hypothetical protein
MITHIEISKEFNKILLVNSYGFTFELEVGSRFYKTNGDEFELVHLELSPL